MYEDLADSPKQPLFLSLALAAPLPCLSRLPLLPLSPFLPSSFPLPTPSQKVKQKEKEMRLLILGLDNAGKTTILKVRMYERERCEGGKGWEGKEGGRKWKLRCACLPI